MNIEKISKIYKGYLIEDMKTIIPYYLECLSITQDVKENEIEQFALFADNVRFAFDKMPILSFYGAYHYLLSGLPENSIFREIMEILEKYNSIRVEDDITIIDLFPNKNGPGLDLKDVNLYGCSGKPLKFIIDNFELEIIIPDECVFILSSKHSIMVSILKYFNTDHTCDVIKVRNGFFILNLEGLMNENNNLPQNIMRHIIEKNF
jgi:hypothetical protein